MAKSCNDTCFSLIEKLAPLYEEYGEEQIVVALAILLEREYNNSDEHDDPILLSQTLDRVDDLNNLNDKWAMTNESFGE